MNQIRIEERRDAQSIAAGGLVPLAQEWFARGNGVRRGSTEAFEITASLDQLQEPLMLIPRNAGDVHIYGRRRWGAATSAACPLQALELVQCPVEAALDRGLVA